MTLDNLNKVLAALQTSSPHTTISHTWKDPAWATQRAEAIKIVQDEIDEKTPLDFSDPRIQSGIALYKEVRNKASIATTHATAMPR